MNFSNINNNFYLDNEIRTVLSSYFEQKDVNLNNPEKYSFICNICHGGQSEKNKHRKRTYILKNREPYVFYCHNCGYCTTAKLWLEEYFPFEYKQYVKNILRVNKDLPQPKIIKPVEVKKQVITKKELENIKTFIPILKGEGKLFDSVIKSCKDRLIPEKVWHKWFVAISGTYKNRMIIPYYDNKNQIYFYEGRSLQSWLMPKYLSREGDFNNIYNYYTVDKNKVITVLEGVIDSLFVENSISLTGLKIDDPKLKEFKNIRFLLDYDKEDITQNAKKKSLKLLEQGKSVFSWKMFMKDYGLPDRSKWDINEVVIYLGKEKFSIEDLDKYFYNSTYSKALFV